MKKNAHILVHKASSLLLSILMLLSNMAPAVAYAIEDKAKYSEDEYFEYELRREGYKIKKLKDKSKYFLEENDFTLTIPESHNDIPVIGLGKNSLQNEKIKKLNLPNTIKEIDDFAIYKDEKGDGLEEINIYPEQRDEETGEVIEQRINIERIGEKAIENQDLKDLPFNVRILEESSLKNNNFTKLDLSDTETIRKDSLTQEGELDLILNKYSEIEQPFYNEEKTNIEYIEKEFNKKETDNTDIDYLAIRQRALNSENNKKEEEDKTEENNEDSEESHHDKKESEESYDNKEKQGKIKDSRDYKVIEGKRTLDEILEDAELEEPQEINKRDNNRDGVRPETLKVEIYANDILYKWRRFNGRQETYTAREPYTDREYVNRPRYEDVEEEYYIYGKPFTSTYDTYSEASRAASNASSKGYIYNGPFKTDSGYAVTVTVRIKETRTVQKLVDHWEWVNVTKYKDVQKTRTVKGTYKDEVTSTNRSEYPDNGKKGSYFFEYAGIAKPPKRVKISAQKLLNGRVTSRKFSFNLYEEGNKTPIQTKENIRKLVDFDEIIYEDGFVGPKTYFIEEISTEGDGIIYDKSIFKAEVSENKETDEIEIKYFKKNEDGSYSEVEEAIFKNDTKLPPPTGLYNMDDKYIVVLVISLGLSTYMLIGNRKKRDGVL